MGLPFLASRSSDLESPVVFVGGVVSDAIGLVRLGSARKTRSEILE